VLAYSIVTSKTAEPRRYMMFLHGILGTRANWRGIARRFVEGRPGWGAILVDLREHGDSLGFRGPHTVSAAAADVAALASSLELPIEGALGHSFGGKVVLRWLAARPTGLTEVWVVDSSPSAISGDRDGTATAAVLRTLGELPRQWPSKDAFIAALTEAGQPEPIAQWLAMNLRRTDDGGRTFGPDLGAIRDLVEDYGRTDLWNVIEALPEGNTLDLIIGGRSHAFSSADRERAEAIAERDPRVSVHVIADAGHWVHVDSPDTLVSLLTGHFAGVRPDGN
jgi:esterase